MDIFNDDQTFPTDEHAADPFENTAVPVPEETVQETDVPSAVEPAAEWNAPVFGSSQPTAPAAPVSAQTFPRSDAPVQVPAPERKASPYAQSPYVNYQLPPQQPYQPAPPRVKAPKEKKDRRPFWKTAVAAVLTVALVAGGCLITADNVNRKWENRNAKTIEQFNLKINELQKQIDGVANKPGGNSSVGTVQSIGGRTPGQVYAENVDSVVAISTTVRVSNMFGQVSEGAAAGSGFILTGDGYVVTNYHVVEDATKISVITHSGDSYEAALVGKDSSNDVAVLKIDAEGLSAAVLGSSDNLAIGDMVVAIGNPLGELSSTQTVGYVSGKNREVTTDNTVINMIQTDAAINPGNSGGPLFNMDGEVVGITTAKYSGTTSSGASIEGIGFAIPINDVMSIISDLKDLGYVTGAYLGVTVQNTNADSAAYFGLPSGAYVVSVVEDGSAHRAGIQPKDIIISLGSHRVSNVTDLTRGLRSFKAGDTTTVTVVRGGATLELTITLDERPQDLDKTPAESASTMPSEGNYEDWYNFFRPFFEGGRG